MKVVLFCGGFGMRIREYSHSIPKPMVPIGSRPILWQVMKYYAHFGHKDFILCLGWKGDVIKDYFLNYDECVSNDFVLSGSDRTISLLSSDIHDWNITFVDTGNGACVGERLQYVAPLLKDEPTFLANYTDVLCDVQLPDLLDFHTARDSLATFVSVKPHHSFHSVHVSEGGMVHEIQNISQTETWINGGFLVLSSEIFDYMHPGEELVNEPFGRLIDEGRLHSLKHHGFWSCMDTYKEKQMLDEMFERGDTPWEVWDRKPKTIPSIVAAQTSAIRRPR